MGYRIDVTKPQGERISDMTLLTTGEQIDPARNYVVAGWASVNEGTEGPPIWDVVESHIRKLGTVSPSQNDSVDGGRRLSPARHRRRIWEFHSHKRM